MPEYWTREDAEKFIDAWMNSHTETTGISEMLAMLIAAYEQGRRDEHNDPKH